MKTQAQGKERLGTLAGALDISKPKTQKAVDAQHIQNNKHRRTLHELTTSIRKKISTNAYLELDIFNNNPQYSPSGQNLFSDLLVAQKGSCGHLHVHSTPSFSKRSNPLLLRYLPVQQSLQEGSCLFTTST